MPAIISRGRGVARVPWELRNNGAGAVSYDSIVEVAWRLGERRLRGRWL